MHKLLIAARQVADKRNDLWITGDDAYTTAKNFKIQKDMREACQRAVRRHRGKDTVKVSKKQGVYNMRAQVPHGASTSKSRRHRGAAEEPRCVCGNFSFIGRTPAGHETVRLERHHDEIPVSRVPEAEPEFDGLSVNDEAEHGPDALAKVRRPIIFTVDTHVCEIVVGTA